MAGTLNLADYPIKSFEIISDQPSVVSVSQSGVHYSRNVGAHLWKLKIETDMMARLQYQALWAFLISQNGRLENFEVTLPVHGQSLGTVTGTVTVSSWTDDNTVILTNVGGGSTLKAGDMFQFADHTKVYMCTADTSESGGDMTVNLMPSARTQSVTGTLLDFTPSFTVVLDDSEISIKRDTYTSSLKITCMEALT